MCCQLKSCCCWSLRTGAIITSVLTALWCIYVLAVGIFFFTDSLRAVHAWPQDTSKEVRQSYGYSHDKIYNTLGHHVLSWIYIGFMFLGIIAFVSLVAGIAQQKHCPIIFWFCFMTLGLILSVVICVVHIFTEENLNLFIKITGPVFAVVFIYPWIVTYSYYKHVQINMPNVNYAGIVLSQPQPYRI
uniref:Uncharacterized protein n=1 Tax=Strigamia maritima TaxID=126957 RepID=T1IJY1_STRMM